jgi:type II secretory pathway pseudopilin PulG
VRYGPTQNGPTAEAGFILIEILVSALVLVIASAGVVALLQTTVRSQAEERHASEAYSLAQEDQARLSAMRIEDLLRLNQKPEEREITLNQTRFTVKSTGVGINDITSAPSCGEGTYKVNYVQVTSVVTWPGMASPEKAKIVNKIAPLKGSTNQENGSLAVSVTNQAQAPMPEVELSGGSGAIKGATDATGCAIFPNLLKGNYQLTASGAKTGLVNHMGASSEAKTVGVVGGDTIRQVFEFDRAGTIPVEFKYLDGSGKYVEGSGLEFAATADSIVVNSTGMESARIFSTSGGARSSAIKATPLFPFSSAYTIYAGSCESNKPGSGGAAAMANVVAPAGGEAAPVKLQLPALQLVVKNGISVVEGATITITDRACRDASNNLLKRTYTSNKKGLPSNSATGPAELGLPWGRYDICASASISGSVRRKKVENVSVQSLTSTPTVPIDLSSGTSSEPCP